MTEFLLFNRWSTKGIEITDPGLRDYICLKPILIPKSSGKYSKHRFYKSYHVNIVERLLNKLMVSGHRGKKHKLTSGHFSGDTTRLYKTIVGTFEIIEQKIKQNPIAVLVRAIENAAPRDEITSIEYGGAKYPTAVECAPQRRVDLALKHLCQGAYSKSFKSKKSLAEALAEEIINAYECKQESFAISKKLELERQASASR